MKNGKNLVLIITSIILVVFIGSSFLIYDKSDAVVVKGTTGSYAEIFAKNNDLEFIAIADSDNPNVDIPVKDEDAKGEEKTEEKEDVPTVKDNGTFSYNYVDDKSVTIVAYKGTDSLVVIPDTIDTLPVTKVAFNPLESNIDVVQFSDNVTAIEGEYAVSRYTAEFFVALAIMVIGYAYAVVVTLMAFKKSDSNEKTFYGIPVAYNGIVAFVIMTIAAAVFIILNLPIVAMVVVTIVILAISAIGLVKTTVARSAVEATGEKVKQQTAFIRLLTADAQTLMSQAKTSEAQTECKKVYETIRYSDPMSNANLAYIEAQINTKFSEFSNAVKNNDSENISNTSNELIALITDRNNKCKLLK